MSGCFFPREDHHLNGFDSNFLVQVSMETVILDHMRQAILDHIALKGLE